MYVQADQIPVGKMMLRGRMAFLADRVMEAHKELSEIKEAKDLVDEFEAAVNRMHASLSLQAAYQELREIARGN